MSTSMWQDDLDDIDSDVEAYDDSETGEDLGDDLDSEGLSRSERQRRARQRRIALAQRRQAQRRVVRPPVRPTPAPQQAISAVRTLDLETKVQQDAFRASMVRQASRMNRAEYAAVLGAATNQFIESFQQPKNVYFKALLRYSPLLLLSPQKRGTGVDGLVRDPRVLGAAAVLGITFAGDNQFRLTAAKEVRLTIPGELATGDDVRVYADALDGRGRRVDTDITFESDDPGTLEITDRARDTAKVRALKAGRAVLTVRTGDGVVNRIPIQVLEAGAAAAAPAGGGAGAPPGKQG